MTWREIFKENEHYEGLCMDNFQSAFIKPRCTTWREFYEENFSDDSDDADNYEEE
jgi:hypothetical protein